VQLASRPATSAINDFRGYMGRIASGSVRVGDPVVVLPSRQRTTVTGIVGFEGCHDAARVPDSVTLTLEHDLDIARGEVICGVQDAPEMRSEFTATLCWMAEQPLRLGRKYILRQTTQSVKAMVAQIQCVIDVNSFEQSPAAAELSKNAIAKVLVRTLNPIFCDSYQTNRETGGFILVDEDGTTAAAGIVES
jgi:sulfate adenylyltransferase subunit 1